MTFGGVDPLLLTWAAQQLGVRCVLDIPADLATVAPVVQIVTIGGPSDDSQPALIAATVSVDSFAADYPSASALAWRVDEAFRRHLPGTTVNGTSFGAVRTLTVPSRRPWDDLAVRRYGAVYQIWLHAALT